MINLYLQVVTCWDITHQGDTQVTLLCHDLLLLHFHHSQPSWCTGQDVATPLLPCHQTTTMYQVVAALVT